MKLTAGGRHTQKPGRLSSLPGPSVKGVCTQVDHTPLASAHQETGALLSCTGFRGGWEVRDRQAREWAERRYFPLVGV